MPEISTNFSTVGSTQPSQDKREWGEKDYIENLRWIAQAYNRPLFNYPYQIGMSSADGRAVTFVDNYILNEQYYYGVQSVTDFQSLTIDESNKPLPISMRKDMDIFELINKVVGVGMQPLKQLPKMISAISVSPNVVSKRMFLKDLAKLMVDQKYFFELMTATSGIEFKPFGDMDFQDEAEIETYFTNYRDALEKAYMNLAKSVTYTNRYYEKFQKELLHCAIGGVCSLEIKVRNGRVYWEVVPPQFSIFDNYKSDPHHRSDRFAGKIAQLTLTELFSRYSFSEKEKEDLTNIASAPENWYMYTSVYNGTSFQWYNTSPNNIPMVTVVEAQWRSLNYMEGDNTPYEVIREGVLIGNKYVKEYGISRNCPEDSRDPSRLRFRYITVSPNMLSGGNRSLVDMLRTFQDEKNAIKTKLFQMIANTKGKRYVVYADRLPMGMNTPEFLSQLTQAGVVVLEGTKMDDNSSDRGEGLVQTIDMTADPSILTFANLMVQWRQTMDAMLSFNPTSIGQVSNYISKEQLQQNVNISQFGMEWFYSAFYEFVKNVLEVSADMAKLSISEAEEDYSLIIGDNMVELLKAEEAEKMAFEQYSLVLSIDDYLSEQDKNFYRQYFIQKASASGNPMDDLIVASMDKYVSKTEFINFIQYITSQKITQQQEQMAMQQQQQQAMAEQAAQAQVESASIAADANLEREAMKTERDLALANQPPQA